MRRKTGLTLFKNRPNIPPYMPRQYEYLIDGCLPSGRVHLLAGPSGVGKTTWLFQAVQTWMEGTELVCGRETRRGFDGKGTFMYIAADRGRDEIEETMERVGIEPGLFPYHSLTDNQHTATNFYRLSESDPNLKILFIEGADCLVEKANDNLSVAQFLKEAGQFAAKRKIAIWFSTGSPKMKKGEEYSAPRDRTFGSVAWGRYSSTIFSMAYGDPANVKDKTRNMIIQPRNHAPSEHWFSIDARGRLIEVQHDDNAASRVRLLAELPPGVWLEAAQFVELGTKLNLSRATVYRYLKTFMEGGQLMKDDKGRYMAPVFGQLTQGRA